MKEFLQRLRGIHFPFLRSRGAMSTRQAIFWGIAALVAVGVFLFMQGFTACWQLTALPGIPPASCSDSGQNASSTFTVNGNGTVTAANLPPTPEVAPPVVEYPQWDGGSRINIVFFGLRGGDPSQADCPLCTDTIIVFTVDPVTKTAGMLSVPRDLYVNIPGFGFSRINTAWTSGEGAKLPGGGPALAMKTVSQVIGVPIQYYVQVDFATFIKFINLIGGIDVTTDASIMNPAKGLLLDPMGNSFPTNPKNPTKTRAPTNTNNLIRITCCGVRHLDGQRALAFARCRDELQGCIDGDVGRSIRQQRVILGIRNKILSADNFANLMAQAPELYKIFSSGIHTNISLADGLKLAVLLKDVPLDSIKQGVIGDQMVNYGNVTLAGQNASILMPIPDKIRVLRDQIFTTGGATSPMAQGDPVALMKADAARVLVDNASFTQGLDARTINYLAAQGMQVGLGAAAAPSNQTVLVVYSPKLYALRYLIQTFGITSSNQILFRPAIPGVDIEVRIGNDWVSKLPAGY